VREHENDLGDALSQGQAVWVRGKRGHVEWVRGQGVCGQRGGQVHKVLWGTEEILKKNGEYRTVLG